MGTVTPLPFAGRAAPRQTVFDRHELTRILDLYGRMVAAGKWRDYAMDFHHDVAIFSAFRRSAERPEYRIEKRPALRSRQGMWALVSEGGAVLKRGDELTNVLAPVERKLMKLVVGGS
ncbi:DUF2794 domain-containing protein [Sphingopyxis granuli]|uniref:DUF2794 domain-containing protein n=1 Tax=Sphingopyxis granuli TaxID=267128 RepID=UPI0008351341|nr:DUF2794 domain-containing protein [Sphingopyxis granuli]